MNNKKRHIDFLLEDYDDERLIFRFYPRQSHCHGFGDEPPTDVNGIYKVYYAYSIIRQYKWDFNDQWESRIVFEERCDECSIIDEVGERCKLLSEGRETFYYDDDDGEITTVDLCGNKMLPQGMGVDWTINKRKNWKGKVYYEFLLFDYYGVGFRFHLEQERMKDFGEYLLECCEYMLQHGEPI